jgi:hypothetical protein
MIDRATDDEVLRLLEAFYRITEPITRAVVLSLIESLIEGFTDEPPVSTPPPLASAVS